MKNCVKNSNSTFMAKVMLLCFSLIIALPIISSSVLMLASSDAYAQAADDGAAVAAAADDGGDDDGDGVSTDDNILSQTMCRVLKIVTGTGGKTFAAFAIVSVGIGFFTGKVSWGLMVGVAAGIAAIFGAPSIVAALSGTGAADCNSILDDNT